jgi:sec-independent protein translocase protein TatC
MQAFLRNIWRILTAPFRFIRWLALGLVGQARKVLKFLNYEPEERPIGDVLAETIQQPSGLIEHITALRKHLIRMMIGLLVCVCITLFITPQIVELFAAPIGGLSALKAIDVTETIGVFMKVALLGAVTLASPYIAFELWLFAAPGLRPGARWLGLLSIPLVLIFFVGGMVFAYFILLPPALKFLLNFMGITVTPRPSTYIGFVTTILFWIGITFEFPLVIYVLTLMGIVQPKTLLKQWRIAVVVIAIVAAAITPTVDPVNMSLVMGPMIALYFLSIGLGYLALSGRRRRVRAKV